MKNWNVLLPEVKNSNLANNTVVLYNPAKNPDVPKLLTQKISSLFEQIRAEVGTYGRLFQPDHSLKDYKKMANNDYNESYKVKMAGKLENFIDSYNILTLYSHLFEIEVSR